MCGLAWVLNAYATSLAMLYVGAAVGGIGAGAVYGTCVGNSLKWFPDKPRPRRRPHRRRLRRGLGADRDSDPEHDQESGL